MASLSGNTINTTYQGLIKTESNGDFTTGFQYLTDGVGTRLPLWLDPSTRQAGVENNFVIDNYSVQSDEPDFSIINHRFDATQSPMSPFSGDSINMNMYDKNGVYVGGYDFQRFGNLYHRSYNGEHIFTTASSNPAAPSPKVIMGQFNSPNNSDAWFEAWNKSIYSLTLEPGNILRFNTQDNTNYDVTLPSGGGTSITLYSGQNYGNAWSYSPNMITASGYGQRIIMRPVWLEAGTYSSLHAWYQTPSSQAGSFNRYAVYNADTTSVITGSGNLVNQPTTLIWSQDVDATITGGVNITMTGNELVIPTSGIYVEAYIYDNGVDQTMSGGFSSFKVEGVQTSLYGKYLPYKSTFAGVTGIGTTHTISVGQFTTFPADLSTTTSWTNTSIAPGWGYKLA